MRQGAQHPQRDRQRVRHQAVDDEPPVCEMLHRMLSIFRSAGHARAVRAEDRRQIGFAILAGERVAWRNQPLASHRQLLSRAQHASELRAVVQAVAAAKQQARSAGGDEAPAVDHASSLPSGGTRKRPVIIEPISLIGPASITIVRWTRMKASSRAAQMKWIDRADWRPPNKVSSQ